VRLDSFAIVEEDRALFVRWPHGDTRRIAAPLLWAECRVTSILTRLQKISVTPSSTGQLSASNPMHCAAKPGRSNTTRVSGPLRCCRTLTAFAADLAASNSVRPMRRVLARHRQIACLLKYAVARR
jgi:hypothetical protein